MLAQQFPLKLQRPIDPPAPEAPNYFGNASDGYGFFFSSKSLPPPVPSQDGLNLSRSNIFRFFPLFLDGLPQVLPRHFQLVLYLITPRE